MKENLILILLSLLFVSCSKDAKKETEKPLIEPISSLEVPINLIDKEALYYDTKTSLWTLNGELFSGYAVSYFPDSTLLQKFGVLEGRKQNDHTNWFPDGHIKHSANYHKGKLHGEKKSFSVDSSHILISQLNFHLGKAHGYQKKWYPTGEIFKIIHFNMGLEEGIQQAFRKNGDLFANYEAREGRIFGLKRAALCFGLEDEEIKYAE